jgi:16S rRNA (uracil1498-N3)-methyltransferase
VAHFYLNESLSAPTVGATIELVGAEARHAVTVSRVHVGDSLTVGNGSGCVATGTVVSADAALLTLTVATVTQVAPSTPALWLVQALAKGDRDEMAVQAATELGVDGVVPWAASRSVSRWEGAKVAKGHMRWSAIVREATKQSTRAWLPEVAGIVATKQLLALAATTQMLVLEPDAGVALTSCSLGTEDIVVVVGPEGGIAPRELELLAAAGATLVRLGDTVLRTSTAGPAAVAVLNAKLGRW